MLVAMQLFLESRVAGAIVAATTTTAGAVTLLDVIPDDIGKLATLAGIVASLCGAALSLVLIYVHLARLRRDRRRDRS